ncbi:type II secretion system protein GspC [Enterobacter wuhouensis]|uniref:Type II secretion system protein GspC n=1 Tax=Enterobacter wuhouensis TaxID=2529381 RepID=A0A4R0GC34_9ENTR|nr:type II secretion system protein GspC [Enterobacter wuhouensis]TCB93622.1 type II secretion system protein GspC [Enterobacter wuhouensis]WRW32992.1 type II secretion system protein GspC [Enterobacter wuhouensis]
MFVLLIFCGQQGYLTFKEYKKVTNKLANSDEQPLKNRRDEKTFTLFTAAVRQDNVPTAVKAPLAAEIEGIVSSDDAWLSFAVIKTPGGQKSYREGEALTGFNDAFIQEINKDNVVVNYEGATQVLALNKPDYFKGGVDSGPVAKSTKDAGADSLHLDDYLVLKPLIEKGQLEGYNINPRNASSFFSHSGLQKGDVAVKVNSVDMTNEGDAKSVIASWSKMKEAEVVVRRHAHLENIRVNVLNN